MFSDHSAIKLEINNRKITGKSLHTCKLINTLLNNLCVKDEVSSGKKIHWREWKSKSQFLEHNYSSAQREINNIKCTRKQVKSQIYNQSSELKK